jgi:hypothetical protein
MPSNVVKEGGEKNIESVIIPNRGREGGGSPGGDHTLLGV